MQNNIDFNNKHILISGGAGFIGSNLAFYFQENFPESNIVIFDCFRNESSFSNGNLKSLGHFHNLINFKGQIICGNINNPNDLLLLNKYSFDFIFHLAAISDTRVYNQEIILKTNINSFYSFLEMAKKDNAVLVYASSAATYGNLPPPQKVGIENPENPYGYSKYVMDNVAKLFSKKNPRLSIIGLRYFNVYGPREYFKGATASMISQLGHQMLENKMPRLFEGSDQIFRDFIYIDDVVKANINACNSKTNGVYNIGTGISRSFKDIVDILQIELNTNFDIDYFQNPYDNYQTDTKADINYSKIDLNFYPEFSLEQGIKMYVPEILSIHGTEI